MQTYVATKVETSRVLDSWLGYAGLRKQSVAPCLSLLKRQNVYAPKCLTLPSHRLKKRACNAHT